MDIRSNIHRYRKSASKYQYIEINGRYRKILKLADTKAMVVIRQYNEVYIIEAITYDEQNIMDALFQSCKYDMYPETITERTAKFWISYFNPEKMMLENFYELIQATQKSVEDKAKKLLDWNALYNPHNMDVVLYWIQCNIRYTVDVKFNDNELQIVKEPYRKINKYISTTKIDEAKVGIRAVDVINPNIKTIIFKSKESLQWLYDILFD